MYYRCFFCKENAFNAVFFFSILLFAILKSIIYPDELSQISLMLSVLIALLSVVDLFIKSLETIINDQDKKTTEAVYYLSAKYNKDDVVFSFTSIQKINKKEFSYYLLSVENILQNQYDKDQLILYWEITKVKFTFRKARRILLYLYYCLLITVTLLLMFSTNISDWCKSIEFPDLTIWSFIIILFELLLSQPLYAAIFARLSKYYNKRAKKLSELEESNLLKKG